MLRLSMGQRVSDSNVAENHARVGSSTTSSKFSIRIPNSINGSNPAHLITPYHATTRGHRLASWDACDSLHEHRREVANAVTVRGHSRNSYCLVLARFWNRQLETTSTLWKRARTIPIWPLSAEWRHLNHFFAWLWPIAMAVWCLGCAI